MDSWGDGWPGVNFTINGVAYCGNFETGFRQTEDIFIPIDVELRNETFRPNKQFSCFNISLSTKEIADDIFWSLGTCSTDQEYQVYATYREECCLEIGDYILTCIDTREYGWKGATITINGTVYCGNFEGYRHTEIINISTGVSTTAPS